MNSQKRLCFLHEVKTDSLREFLFPIRQNWPELGVLVILPEADKDKVEVLQAVCRDYQIPLAGGIFPRLVVDHEFHTEGAWIICYEEAPCCLLYESIPEDPDEVEQRIRLISHQISEKIDGEIDITLYMVFDVTLLNISTLIDLLYLNLANSVNYAGMNAGSESFKPMPCLFDNEKIVSGGMLLCLIKGNKGAVLEHGCHGSEPTVYATSTDKNRICQINWRPAFEVYQELVRTQYGIEINRHNFYKYSVHFPFGIKRANEQIILRIPAMLEDDGTLFCLGEIPDNSVLTLLKMPSVDSEQTILALSNGLNDLYGSTQGAQLMLFYCAGRRVFIGTATAIDELKAFKRITGASLVGGALSLGEIGGSSVDDYPLFHHAALVAARL